MLAMDWNWWNAGSANQFGIRPELRSVHSPWLANSRRTPLERHGGIGINVLWADLHVSFKDAFAWDSRRAFSCYVPGTPTLQPNGSEPIWFYYPTGCRR